MLVAWKTPRVTWKQNNTRVTLSKCQNWSFIANHSFQFGHKSIIANNISPVSESQSTGAILVLPVYFCVSLARKSQRKKTKNCSCTHALSEIHWFWLIGSLFSLIEFVFRCELRNQGIFVSLFLFLSLSSYLSYTLSFLFRQSNV